MRKILLMAMILLGGAFSLCVYADEPINVPLQFINEEEISQGNTKAPMRPLFITQDGNILTLAATPVDYTLVLYMMRTVRLPIRPSFRQERHRSFCQLLYLVLMKSA